MTSPTDIVQKWSTRKHPAFLPVIARPGAKRDRPRCWACRRGLRAHRRFRNPITQRGAKESGGGSDLTLKLDYIDIPVLARYDVTLPNSAARPFFLAGPTFSFQVSCDAEESGEGGSISASCDAVNQQNEGSLSKKSFDTGATLGAGVAFPVDKKMDLSFSVRYTHGLIDTFDNADAKNRTWSFMAGLTF